MTRFSWAVLLVLFGVSLAVGVKNRGSGVLWRLARILSCWNVWSLLLLHVVSEPFFNDLSRWPLLHQDCCISLAAQGCAFQEGEAEATSPPKDWAWDWHCNTPSTFYQPQASPASALEGTVRNCGLLAAVFGDQLPPTCHILQRSLQGNCYY